MHHSSSALRRLHHRSGGYDGAKLQDAVLLIWRSDSNKLVKTEVPAAPERGRGRAICGNGSDWEELWKLLHETVGISVPIFFFFFLNAFLFLGGGGGGKGDSSAQ